jgi:hypothetical protein
VSAANPVTNAVWVAPAPALRKPLPWWQRGILSAAILLGGSVGALLLMMQGSDGESLVWVGAIVVLAGWTATTSRPPGYAALFMVGSYVGLASLFAFGHLIRIRDYQSYGMGAPGGCMMPSDSYQSLNMRGVILETSFGDYGFMHENVLTSLVLLLPVLVTAYLFRRWANQPLQRRDVPTAF